MACRRGTRGRDEDGQVLSLVVLLLVITGASARLVGEVAEVVDRARVGTAADAAGWPRRRTGPRALTGPVRTPSTWSGTTVES